MNSIEIFTNVMNVLILLPTSKTKIIRMIVSHSLDQQLVLVIIQLDLINVLFNDKLGQEAQKNDCQKVLRNFYSD